MVLGGDIDKAMLIEAFSKIKDDIGRLNLELSSLKNEHSAVLEENMQLKKALQEKSFGQEDISKIVQETVNHLQKKSRNSFQDSVAQKINKQRRAILRKRIEILAEEKRRSLPEIKDIVVEQEGLCSKATFYRYVDKLKKKGLIELMKLDDIEVVVKL